MDFILASGSRGRRELLQQKGYAFKIVPSNIPEHELENPKDTVILNAMLKALFVAAHTKTHLPIVGCDTIVFYKGKIIGKPKTPHEARKTLSLLQGKTHTVYSALCVVKGEQMQTSCSKAYVTLAKLSKEEIRKIANDPKTLERAGAYAIQEGMVAHIRKRKDTVIGIDVLALARQLKKIR